MTASPHNIHSSYREALIEHLFIGELLRYLWSANSTSSGPVLAEVLKPQVDDAGYDLAIQVDDILRHIQLKASYSGSSTANQKIHLRLAGKPSGCVIWVIFNHHTMELGPYLWFGGKPGEKLPEIESYRTAKHSKGDSTGFKAERPMLRVVPKGAFKKLETIEQLSAVLFGGTRHHQMKLRDV